MDGFENYLAAALGKKKVPLVPVADKEHADYVITGTSLDKKAGWAKIVFMGNIHSDNAASVTMTDVKTGAIVYAYAVDKKKHSARPANDRRGLCQTFKESYRRQRLSRLVCRI
jgi:hypothetical protein